jgi:hypothetical protein
MSIDNYEFEAFPKIPRLKTKVIVTEKIDGTNAQVAIFGPYPANKCSLPSGHPSWLGDVEIDTLRYSVFAGSRNRYVTPGNDNFGFAGWVHRNMEELVATLGPGRHYGEWWGSGIQRRYGLSGGDKRFSLFNTLRWMNEGAPKLPEILSCVPVLFNGDNPDIEQIMWELKQTGSHAAPGFMDPEGIVYYHCGSREKGLFKCTFENDKGKWTQQDNSHERTDVIAQLEQGGPIG